MEKVGMVSKCCGPDEIFDAGSNSCKPGNFSYENLMFYKLDWNSELQEINVRL